MNKNFFLKTIILVLFLIVLGFTLFSKFISPPERFVIPTALEEKFNEKLCVINTPVKLDSVVRGRFALTGYDTARTLLFIDELLRNRFYHCYSELSFHDNWIAVVCGKIFWSHFLNPVVPEDIIRFPMAGCSQQGILFQDQLNRLHIPSCSVQFYPMPYQSSGHYAVTAYYGSAWHYFDPNLEPIIVDSSMPSIENIIERKLYAQMYTKKVHKNFKEYFLNKSYKRVNDEPFHKGNMYYFHKITGFLSDWLWLFLLTAYFLLFLRPKKDQKLSFPQVKPGKPVHEERVA